MGPAQVIQREEKDILTHTHTHNINYLILLLRNIQLINPEYTPYKYRTDTEPT